LLITALDLLIVDSSLLLIIAVEMLITALQL
jgi:hypothetical protein